MRVDLATWHFDYARNGPIDRALFGQESSLESFRFPNIDCLLQHLDGPGNADRVRFQISIRERLKQDPDVAAIKVASTPLKDLKHFSAYRRAQFDKYHDAARRLASGEDTDKDRKLVDGFDAEVAASKVLLEPGQVLFHGRCNDLLVAQHPYPTYVSATLDPIVALNSAFRRAGSSQVSGRPTVVVLELRVPLRALWGQVGKSVEWELLLPRAIDWIETSRRIGNRFDVVHAAAIAWTPRSECTSPSDATEADG